MTDLKYSKDELFELIIKNCKKMFSDRNYIIQNESVNMNKYLYEVILDDNSEIIVKVYFDENLNITKNSIVYKFINSIPVNKKLILILRQTNNKIINAINNIRKENIEIFLIHEMIFLPTEHILVPKHILITDSNEINKILKQYLLNKKTIPKINKSDRVSRHFDAKVGNLFKIIRPSEITGESIYYRLVI